MNETKIIIKQINEVAALQHFSVCYVLLINRWRKDKLPNTVHTRFIWLWLDSIESFNGLSQQHGLPFSQCFVKRKTVIWIYKTLCFQQTPCECFYFFHSLFINSPENSFGKFCSVNTRIRMQLIWSWYLFFSYISNKIKWNCINANWFYVLYSIESHQVDSICNVHRNTYKHSHKYIVYETNEPKGKQI